MTIDLYFYWKLFWRRLPAMMLFLLACSTLGVITALKLPETWNTSARLLVEAPQIPDRMAGVTLDTDPIEQLDIIQQKLLARANLIDIAHRFDVYENIRRMDPDTVVEEMRRDSRIRLGSGKRQATVMTISFNARNGRIARDVVNEYVTLALQENSDLQAGRAENTLNFFEQEVERLSEDLNVQSARIAVFKSENANALPEEQNYRLNQQTGLQERISRLERELIAVQNQRSEVLRVYELSERQDNLPPPNQRSPEEEQLAAARLQLQEALSIYSENHPHVIRLNARIEQLEKMIENSSSGDPGTNTQSQASRQEMLMQASLAEFDVRIDFIEADIKSANELLEQLKLAIAKSSANGIELAKLERDYANIQARYNTAVNNLSQAQVNERIESTAQGQRITALENASLPQAPSGPNRSRIILVGFMAGLALAVAYFVLLELINRSIRRPSELINRFNVQPVAVVPYMESSREKFRRRAGILTATAVVLVAVPLGLWYIDSNYMPLELFVQKGLHRLGLG